MVAILTTKQILIWHFITWCQRHPIPYIRLSEKDFPLSNYQIRKSCVVCAYDKNSAGKYKKKTSNSREKSLCLQKLS